MVPLDGCRASCGDFERAATAGRSHGIRIGGVRRRSCRHSAQRADISRPPTESLARIVAQLDRDLQQDILERIAVLSSYSFEKLVLRVMIGLGFAGTSVDEAAVHLGRAGDDGVDGVIYQDALGIDRVYIQAKRFARSKLVGPSDVRDFFGALEMARASKGVFIATSSFSPAAQTMAERLHHRIALVDGERLAQLMIRHDVGVRIEQTFHIKKIDEDFFLDE